jgi:hypothetical protein
MTDTDARLIERLREDVAQLGEMPICPDWMQQAIRHCVRNMDFEWAEGFNEPSKYSGAAMARIVNDTPALLDRIESLTAALRNFVAGADAGIVSVEVDKAARTALGDSK